MSLKQLREVLTGPAKIAVVVSALGYFVDAYDLVLFSITRVISLKSMGLNDAEVLSSGAALLQWQMTGMMIGGILWGILGDKRGRIQVLFGSIFLYSVANILNAFVTDVEHYKWLRFFAGLGLAGELGAGITLVSELLPKHLRGMGTTFVATVGVMGVVVAALVGKELDWQTAYLIGGVGGFCLLLLRISVHESGMFKNLEAKQVSRGNFLMILGNRARLLRYLQALFIGIPIWGVIGVVITFSPEITAALGIQGAINVPDAILYHYIGLTIGDFGTGYLSQVMHSRKKILWCSIILMALSTLYTLNLHGATANTYYFLFFLMGLFVGYWAVFVTTAAEQFGTNLRATVATTAPNFVRFTAVPATAAFKAWKDSLGIPLSASLICGTLILIALLALWKLPETYGVDLDYIET